MLSNGDREAARGDYDQAALRVYRAIELFVDRRLKWLYEIDNSKVMESQVPEPLREDLFRGKGTPCQLAQYASAQLLDALGDTPGQRLFGFLRDNKLDNFARNKNWLIHDTQHVNAKRFGSYKVAVLQALGIDGADIPEWPDFRP